MKVELPYPTKTRLNVFAEVVRREIRWYHFATPEAVSEVTDRTRTAAVRELADAKIVHIPPLGDSNYTYPEPTDLGRRWAAGAGSTSPEPGPADCNATSPSVGEPPTSRRCDLAAHHDSYHGNGNVTWRDPEPILGEPKPWHPDHRPHAEPGPDGEVA